MDKKTGNDDTDQNIRLAILESILDKSYRFVGFVDQRASIVLAADGAMMALVLASFSDLFSNLYGVILILGFMVNASISVAYAFRAIRPSHIKMDEPQGLMYFGHIVEKKRCDYASEVLSKSIPGLFENLCNEIYTLSVIVHYKYTKLKISLDAFLLALVLLLASLLLKVIAGR